MLHRPLTLGSAICPQRKAILQCSEEEVATKKPASAKRGRKATEPVKPRIYGRPRNAVQSYKEATPDSEDVVPKKQASLTEQRKDEAANDSDSSIPGLGRKPNDVAQRPNSRISRYHTALETARCIRRHPASVRPRGIRNRLHAASPPPHLRRRFTAASTPPPPPSPPHLRRRLRRRFIPAAASVAASSPSPPPSPPHLRLIAASVTA
jgi:hypothetical protein